MVAAILRVGLEWNIRVDEESGFEFEVVDRGAPLEEGKIYAYAVDFPEAQKVQEIHAVLRDLDFVMRTADYLADLLREWASLEEDLAPGDGSKKDLVARSLWTAAIIAYVRCFAQGTRYRLRKEDLKEQYPGGNVIKLHQYFWEIRDKHVAHSVSPFEVFGTGVDLVQEADGHLRVADLVNAHVTHGHPDAATAEKLGNLAGYVRGFVQSQFEEADRIAKEKAKRMSQEQLRRLPVLELGPGHDPSVVRPQKPWLRS
jgi:hypothetical protein